MANQLLGIHTSVNAVNEAFTLQFESESKYQSILNTLDTKSQVVIAELTIHKDEFNGSFTKVREFIKSLHNLGEKFMQINDLCMKNKPMKYVQVKSEAQSPRSQNGVKVNVVIGFNHKVQAKRVHNLLFNFLPQYEAENSLSFGWDVYLDNFYNPISSKQYDKSELDELCSLLGFKELSHHEICINLEQKEFQNVV